MENINIKVILDEVFGKSCNNIACELIVDDSPIVDPENDVFGYYD